MMFWVASYHKNPIVCKICLSAFLPDRMSFLSPVSFPHSNVVRKVFILMYIQAC